LSGEALAALGRRILDHPAAEVQVDLDGGVVRVGRGWEAGFEMPAAAREALLTGRWDPLAELLGAKEQVAEVMRGLPYMGW
jgi:3-isopropylmalate/(R)-2-methylmalate dehydratase small subunit